MKVAKSSSIQNKQLLVDYSWFNLCHISEPINESPFPFPTRQANEGVWKKQDDFSNPLSRHNDDLRKFSDFDIPTSPPLTISDLGGSNSLSNWSPHSSLSRGHGNPSGQHKDNHPPVPHKGKALEELERRSAADKVLSVEVRLVGVIISPVFSFFIGIHMVYLTNYAGQICTDKLYNNKVT